MAELYTPDATYGWNYGPNEDFMAVGRDEIRDVALGLEMGGLDGWEYPYQKVLIDEQAGEVIGLWKQIAATARRRHLRGRGHRRELVPLRGQLPVVLAARLVRLRQRHRLVHQDVQGGDPVGRDGASYGQRRQGTAVPIPGGRGSRRVLGLSVGATGFIGLGNIGSPMAKRLLAHDDGLVVFDTRAEACAPLTAKGARAADSLAEMAAETEVVSVMVRDDAQVREVVAGLLEHAHDEMVIAVHSTIRAETAIELEVQAAARGVALVDAPVSGGAMGAHQGTLAALVGGSDEAIERCRPVFSHWASLVVHFGPVGAGTNAKLARNLLHFIAFTAVGEAQRLAEAAGLDLMKLGDVVRHTDKITGGPGAIMLRTTAGEQQPGDDLYEPFANAASLGEKDLALALALGDELGVELPLGHLAVDRLALEMGVPHSEHHHSEQDRSGT